MAKRIREDKTGAGRLCEEGEEEMDNLMAEILYQRDTIKMLRDWMHLYRLGFYIASVGWIVTIVGFIILAYR